MHYAQEGERPNMRSIMDGDWGGRQRGDERLPN